MNFGIMQGRLSPPQGGALQFFPKDWRAEFAIAKELGLEAIEWIIDTPVESNPISTAEGREKMRREAEKSGVAIRSICADIFMKEHLTARSAQASGILRELLESAGDVGSAIVGIPFVEDHLPQHDTQDQIIAANVRDAIDAVPNDVRVALEMDLPVDRILSILAMIDSSRVGICYDTGNVMTLGFDPASDIRELGSHIFELHLKDRIPLTRRSVYLGSGGVDFRGVGAALRDVGFDGLCILQAWRGEDYLGDAKRQLEFARAMAYNI